MSDLVGNPEDRFSHVEAHMCPSYYYYIGSYFPDFLVSKYRSDGVRAVRVDTQCAEVKPDQYIVLFKVKIDTRLSIFHDLYTCTCCIHVHVLRKANDCKRLGNFLHDKNLKFALYKSVFLRSIITICWQFSIK